jgi:hypothetical protein
LSVITVRLSEGDGEGLIIAQGLMMVYLDPPARESTSIATMDE